MTKILVIDDDLLALATTTMGLQAVGYEVLQAQNGAMALEICQQESADLALLDIRMPGISGFDVAAVLDRKMIPFIFLTAYSDADMIKTAAASGTYGYLIKPIDVARILPIIEVVLLRADEASKAEQTIANLTYAMEKTREIDVAIGLLMERYKINRVTAFNILRDYSRSHRTKAIVIARKLIAREDLPGFMEPSSTSVK